MDEDNRERQRGWWTLTFTGVDELTEETREHVGKMITDGYTNGEILQEATGPEECRHCGATIRLYNGYWRDESTDPGDGMGGDATCGPRMDNNAPPPYTHEPVDDGPGAPFR